MHNALWVNCFCPSQKTESGTRYIIADNMRVCNEVKYIKKWKGYACGDMYSSTDGVAWSIVEACDYIFGGFVRSRVVSDRPLRRICTEVFFVLPLLALTKNNTSSLEQVCDDVFRGFHICCRKVGIHNNIVERGSLFWY